MSTNPDPIPLREAAHEDKPTSQAAEGGPEPVVAAATPPAPDRARLTLQAPPPRPPAPPKADQGGASGGPGPSKANAPAAAIRPVAGPYRKRRRHRVAFWALIALFVIPVLASGTYLWTLAADQYGSTAGFTVRSDESTSGVDLLGGLTAIGGGSSNTDAEILFEYIASAELAGRIAEELPLKTWWSAPYGTDATDPVGALIAGGDPVFALRPDATIEALHDYWQRMVLVELDSSGLVELRVLAFEPEHARSIARAILDASGELINALSAQARVDATRYAEEELAAAEERLTAARQALTAFRSETRIVDPLADIQGQMGLLNTLEGQLTEAMIEADLLADQTRTGDPRLDQAQRRIEVIQIRIEEERARFSASDGPLIAGRDYASVVAEFERLTVDREFAEVAYTAALGALDVARADAQRQSLYLATFVRPTLAETSEHPRRPMILGLVALFGMLTWAVATLVYYAVRDRR